MPVSIRWQASRPEQRQERESIASFLKQVAACSAQAGGQAGDDAEATDSQAQAEEFAELVDYDRLAKRIEHTGRIDQYSNLSKRQLRAELRRSLTVEPYWAQITIVSVLVPADDPDTRVVYAYTSDATESDKSEVRFVLAHDADSWKLCDWERLDLGMHAAEEWSIYAYYGESPVIQGYVDWSTAIGEADRLIQANDTKAAEEKIKLAETYTVPAELHDLHWALTAYRWQALGDDSAARRCFEMIGSPAEVPGAYYGLMNCCQDSDIPAALEYAELYEQSVGPTPDLCVAKAGMFETMHRSDEALAEWKKLLRIEPQNQTGLRQILLALAEDDKDAIRPYLERLADPIQALVELAESVGWDDPASLQFLLNEVDRTGPQLRGELPLARFRAPSGRRPSSGRRQLPPRLRERNR